MLPKAHKIEEPDGFALCRCKHYGLGSSIDCKPEALYKARSYSITKAEEVQKILVMLHVEREIFAVKGGGVHCHVLEFQRFEWEADE